MFSDSQLTQLHSQGFVVLDNFLDADAYRSLTAEAEQQAYRDAQITDGLQQDIRSDGIAWIEQETAEQAQGNQFISKLEQLATELNQAFYVGIRRTEAHFARYSAGKFYAKHVDNPKGSDNRVFSCVFYMNDQWQADDGGELIIYIDSGEQRLLPMGNRMVVFDSNLAHEVKPAKRTRLSIACWLRRDN